MRPNHAINPIFERRLKRRLGAVLAAVLAAMSAVLSFGAQTAQAAPRALPFQCAESQQPTAMIHVDGAFARAANSWDSPAVGRLLKFQCYPVLGFDGLEWYYTRLGNGTAWIHHKDARLKDSLLDTMIKVVSPSDRIPPSPVPAITSGIPAVSAGARAIYQRAITAGRRADIVTVVGDCNSEAPVFFGRLAAGVVDVSASESAQRASVLFAPSFKRVSQATSGSFSSAMTFDDAWADPKVCAAGEGPLACELRYSNASVVILALGTGDTFVWQEYEGNLKRTIDYAIAQNVLPVLMTKADALESQQGGAPPDHINSVIRRVGAAYGLPVIDFAQGVKSLPNGGLVDERTTEGQSIAPFHISDLGMDVRIMMTLQTLAQIPDDKANKAKPAPRKTVRPIRRPRATPAPTATVKK